MGAVGVAFNLVGGAGGAPRAEVAEACLWLFGDTPEPPEPAGTAQKPSNLITSLVSALLTLRELFIDCSRKRQSTTGEMTQQQVQSIDECSG